LDFTVGSIGVHLFVSIDDYLENLGLTRFDPIFVIPIGSSIKTRSASGLFYDTLSGGLLSPGSTSEKWANIIAQSKSSGRPVVMFAEGTTSNGKGLLPFQKAAIQGFEKKNVLYPAVIKHNPASVNTPLPVSSFKWLLAVSMLLTGVSTKVRLAGKIYPSLGGLEHQLAEGAYRVGRLRKLGRYLDIESKKKFLTAYKKGRW
jgi:1-acylglycerol-3-phosphate O-acyltransferase